MNDTFAGYVGVYVFTPRHVFVVTIILMGHACCWLHVFVVNVVLLVGKDLLTGWA